MFGQETKAATLPILLPILIDTRVRDVLKGYEIFRNISNGNASVDVLPQNFHCLPTVSFCTYLELQQNRS